MVRRTNELYCAKAHTQGREQTVVRANVNKQLETVGGGSCLFLQALAPLFALLDTPKKSPRLSPCVR